MMLITKEIRQKLERNAASEGEHTPPLKLFNPCGPATWLITEIMDDGDTLFGLCDLGHQSPELGYVSLSELQSVRLPFGLAIERDKSFRAEHSLAVYARAAQRAGRIVETTAALDQAAAELEREARTHA